MKDKVGVTNILFKSMVGLKCLESDELSMTKGDEAQILTVRMLGSGKNHMLSWEGTYW